MLGRSPGFEGTRLFCDCSNETVFLTVDSWSDKSHWDLFLNRWHAEYHSLDVALARLTVEDYELLPPPT